MARAEGERYACEKCGAELTYTKPCNCTDDRHDEICCGEQMKKLPT